MTVQPGDRNAAATGRGRLRASHADREHVITTLKIAFVQGLLTKDELDMRLGQTFASRTYADLAAVTADIPAGLTDTLPRRVPASSPAMNAAKFAVVAAVGPGLMAVALDAGNEWGKWLFVLAYVYVMASIVAGGVMLDAWHQKRSSGRLPPGPAQRDRASDTEQDPSSGDDLIRFEPCPRARARHKPDPGASRHASRSPAMRRRPCRPAARRATA